MKHEIRIKRIYEDADKADGYRILVDRLWPRGIKKEAGAFDAWEKELAPSTELRAWFGHKPERWELFKQRYALELEGNKRLPVFVKEQKSHKVITLLYGAKDEEHNHALVLQEYLQKLINH